MVPAKSFKSLLITGVVMSLALLVLSGCNKGGNASGAGSPSSGSSSGGGTQVAGGEGLFKSNGCGKCHGLNGGGGKAPDLSHAGAEAAHDADWIRVHIKNPKTHNPGSGMPAYEGKMADTDIKTLASYLASLK